MTVRGSDVPSVLARPLGCPFHRRCPLIEPGLCDVLVPELTPLVTGVEAACHPMTRHFGVEVTRAVADRDRAIATTHAGGPPLS